MDVRSNRRPLSSVLQRIEHVGVPKGKAYLLIGGPGNGKSSCVLSLARRLQNSTADFGACYINASNKEAPDFYGFQKITDGPLNMNGVPTALQPVTSEGLRGAYPILCPDNLSRTAMGEQHVIAPMDPNLHHTNALTKSALVPYTNNLVIVDEATKIEQPSVMGTLAGVAHEAMFGDYALPKDTTARVFIGNDIGDNSYDVQPPAHFINRVQMYYVYLDFPAVETHWLTIGMDPLFVLFAKEHENNVFTKTVPNDPEPFCTGRSFTLAWEAMSAECERIYDITNVAPPHMPYQPEEWPFYVDQGDGVMAEIAAELRATMASYCGEDVALRFAEFALKFRERPRLEDILNNPNTAKIAKHPMIQESVMAMCAQNANKDTLSTFVKYARRCDLSMASLFCGKVKEFMPTAAGLNPDFMDLLNKSGAVARNVVFGN